MKINKKIFSRSLAVALSLCLLSGCGKKAEETKSETEESTVQTTEVTTQAEQKATPEAVSEEETTEEVGEELDYEAVYAPILDEVVDAVNNGCDGTEEFKYISTGTIEAVMFGTNEDLYKRIRYMIKDISGDGIPELLIGENAAYEPNGEEDDSYIFEGYTCKDGKLVRFLEGWGRNSFQPIDDSTFHYYGSSGAMSSAYGICHISEDGTSLVWDDFYFSDGTDDESIVYYHNKTGEWDKDNSEILDVSGNEFWSKDEEIECKTLDWNTLSEYKGSGAEGGKTPEGDSDSGECPISIDYTDEEPDGSCVVYEPAYVDEYTTHVLFTTKKEVKNFRIVTVTMKDKDGGYYFEHEECYKLDAFSPDAPIYAGMNFPGDLPNNGFIYTDENGKDRFFVISQSGLDGSIGYVEEEL